MVSNSQIVCRAGKMQNSTKHIELSQFAKGPITGIKVLWSEDSIVGLELVFAGQFSTGLNRGNHAINICEDAYSLVQGDYIVEIYGRSSNYVHCFGIKTKKGLTKTWGCPISGDAFRFNLNGYFVSSLKFGVDQHISYLEPVFESEMFMNCRAVQLDLNGKFSETVGKTHKDTIGFNDQLFVKDKWNYTVSQINVWHDGKFVYGVQFFYGMDGTIMTPGAHCSNGNVKCEQIKFNQGEHLVKVLIRNGDILDHLTLVTDQGRIVSCGGTGGNPSLIVAPPGNHFVAFAGGIGGHIHNLTAFFDEI